jgi:hypothetical protein
VDTMAGLLQSQLPRGSSPTISSAYGGHANSRTGRWGPKKGPLPAVLDGITPCTAAAYGPVAGALHCQLA